MSSHLDRAGKDRELIEKLVEICQQLLQPSPTERDELPGVEYSLSGNLCLHTIQENSAGLYFQKPKLSLRESQVLELTVNGFSPEQTAMKLGIKVRTVRKYLDDMKRKIGANSRDQLMARAGYLKICDPFQVSIINHNDFA